MVFAGFEVGRKDSSQITGFRCRDKRFTGDRTRVALIPLATMHDETFLDRVRNQMTAFNGRNRQSRAADQGWATWGSGSDISRSSGPISLNFFLRESPFKSQKGCNLRLMAIVEI